MKSIRKKVSGNKIKIIFSVLIIFIIIGVIIYFITKPTPEPEKFGQRERYIEVILNPDDNYRKYEPLIDGKRVWVKGAGSMLNNQNDSYWTQEESESNYKQRMKINLGSKKTISGVITQTSLASGKTRFTVWTSTDGVTDWTKRKSNIMWRRDQPRPYHLTSEYTEASLEAYLEEPVNAQFIQIRANKDLRPIRVGVIEEIQVSNSEVSVANTFSVQDSPSNNCGENLQSVVNEKQCKIVASVLEKPYMKSQSIPNYPKGCHLLNDTGIYFNNHSIGSANKSSKLLCRPSEIKESTTSGRIDAEIKESTTSGRIDAELVVDAEKVISETPEIIGAAEEVTGVEQQTSVGII